MMGFWGFFPQEKSAESSEFLCAFKKLMFARFLNRKKKKKRMTSRDMNCSELKNPPSS